MKHVLVMGVTGTFGKAVAITLRTHGYEVSALMRHPDRLPVELQGIRVIQGDVMDQTALAQACEGVDTIVYGINPANYDWKDKAVTYLEAVTTMAEQKRLTLLFPGNVYNYDPADGPEIDEQTLQHPRTGKGKIRVAMEQRLKQSTQHGVKVIVLRMGDFIARDSKSSWLAAIVKMKKDRIELSSPGPETLRRTWAYVPDAAEVAVRLLQRADELDGFNTFHFRGIHLSMQQMAKALGDACGKQVSIKDFPWWLVRLASPFSTLFGGLNEMRYLWDEELSLSDEKLSSFLGNVPITDVRTVLRECSKSF